MSQVAPSTSPAAGPFLLGLVGSGIGPSLTPALHMQEAREHAMTYVYRVIDTATNDLDDDALARLLDAAETLGFDALNVTFPYKQSILPHLDDLSADAERLEAVNTVLLRGGRRTGHNTDAYGFRTALREHLPGADLSSVVQIGAGGAGAAVADALLSSGVERLVVIDRDGARAKSLVASLARRFPGARTEAGEPGDLATRLSDAAGLVHCTPTGMAHHPGSPVDGSVLAPHLWVADVVYRPLDTELLRIAGTNGCRVLHGGYMAVYQAARTFELVTGTPGDATRMLAHLATLTRADDVALT